MNDHFGDLGNREHERGIEEQLEIRDALGVGFVCVMRRMPALYNLEMLSRREVLSQLAMAGAVVKFAPAELWAQAQTPAQRFGKEKLIIRSMRPPNFETPVALLGAILHPPLEHFYVQSHMPVPASIDAAAWTLKIAGEVNSPISLSVDENQEAAGQPRSRPRWSAPVTAALCMSQPSPAFSGSEVRLAARASPACGCRKS